jgi:hypothetical protein
MEMCVFGLRKIEGCAEEKYNSESKVVEINS